MARGTTTRDRILEAAQRLVLEHGFGSTTVDAILLRRGHRKEPSSTTSRPRRARPRIGRALRRRRRRNARDADGDSGGDQRRPGRTTRRIRAAFEEAAEAMVGMQPGCLFVSFIYETDLTGGETDEIVARSILLWRERIVAKARRPRPTTAHRSLASISPRSPTRPSPSSKAASCSPVPWANPTPSASSWRTSGTTWSCCSSYRTSWTDARRRRRRAAERGPEPAP